MNAGVRPARGFSLIEAVFSSVIVGVVFLAVMDTVGAARTRRYRLAEQCIARHLAQALADEAAALAYAEPVDTITFGPEPAENTGTRYGFDDVDDYHRWSASPPQHKDGTPMADLAGWTRQATVHYVRPNNYAWVMGSDTGVKRIVVEVLHGERTIVTLWSLKTRNDQLEP